MQAYSQDVRHECCTPSMPDKARQWSPKHSASRSHLSNVTSQPDERHVLPKALPGRPEVKGAVLRAHLQAQLEAHPDVVRENIAACSMKPMGSPSAWRVSVELAWHWADAKKNDGGHLSLLSFSLRSLRYLSGALRSDVANVALLAADQGYSVKRAIA